MKICQVVTKGERQAIPQVGAATEKLLLYKFCLVFVSGHFKQAFLASINAHHWFAPYQLHNLIFISLLIFFFIHYFSQPVFDCLCLKLLSQNC